MEAKDTQEIPILFEDGYLLVINKPVGLVSEGATPSVETWAKQKAEAEPSAHRRNAVLMHRLDKPASGILVIAKTVMATKSIQQQMLTNQFGKKYLCIVKGNASKQKGNVEHFLIKDALSKKSILATKKDKGAKKAVLRIEKAQYDERSKTSLLEISLITGRYHQIRFQMSQLGFPVLGDGLYAPQHWSNYLEIALHAFSVDLIHPKTEEACHFSCLPQNGVWQNWSEKLEAMQ
jgi:23S rRNA pseudouridine1911/1915/1917 synthase